MHLYALNFKYEPWWSCICGACRQLGSCLWASQRYSGYPALSGTAHSFLVRTDYMENGASVHPSDKPAGAVILAKLSLQCFLLKQRTFTTLCGNR